MITELSRIIDIIRQTDAIIFNPEYLNQISVKGPADYVTQADKKVQEYLQNSFQALYPDFAFMGEEKDNSDLDFQKNTWIIDPIDGTANLIHDYQLSTVSVGLWNGELQQMELGVVYQPFTHELFHAVRGQGAYRNGSPIHVSGRRFDESIIAIGTSPYHKEYAQEAMRISTDMLLGCSDIRRFGSAALDISHIACGRTEGFFERILSPWDYAAGLLILQEAGGCITDYAGNSLTGTAVSSVCCSNGLIHQEMLDIIRRAVAGE